MVCKIISPFGSVDIPLPETTPSDDLNMARNLEAGKARMQQFLDAGKSRAVCLGNTIKGKPFNPKTEDGFLITIESGKALTRHAETGALYPEGPAEKWINERPDIEVWVVLRKERFTQEDGLPIIRVVIAHDVEIIDEKTGQPTGENLFAEGDELDLKKHLTAQEFADFEEVYWERRADAARVHLEG